VLFNNPQSQLNITEILGAVPIPATLTIAPGMLIDGQGTITGGSNDTLVNQGIIDADSQGGTLLVSVQTLNNQGTLTEENGGTLSVSAGPRGGGTYTFTGGTSTING